MVKQFLKIAGVKTQAEFYKKYPTEAAFFRAHPEAKRLVHQKMEYGGMYAYQTGGEPVSSDYPDYATFKAAHDAWLISQDIPQIDTTGYNYDMPVTAPGFAGTSAITTPETVQTAQTKLNPYQGASVWDFLSAQGRAGDFATRKKLANTLGIQGYTGRPDQNKLMMQMIAQNPDVLLNITSAKLGSKKSKKVSEEVIPTESYADMVARQAQENPYIMAPDQSIPQTQLKFGQYDPSLGGGGGKIPATETDGSLASKIAAGTFGTAAAAGAGYATFKEIESIVNGIKSGKFEPTGQMKGRLTRLRNKFIKEIAPNVKNQAEIFEKLPKRQQEILKNLDAMEISGDINLTRPGTAAKDLETRGMLNEANAEKIIESDVEAQKMLKEAETEAAALRKANAAKAAAARWGTKAAKVEKAVGLGDKIAQGLRAAGKAKYIAPVVDFGKGFFQTFRRDGGETYPLSDTYSAGSYYGSGGSFIPNPADNAYGVLPKYMYAQGGQNGVQDLYDAGYHLEYLAHGGPTFSNVTQYPHQAYVPALDWLAFGGPTFSNVTQYPHQQYVPALDWMAQGGLVKGSVHDVSDDDVQSLINAGYTIEYL